MPMHGQSQREYIVAKINPPIPRQTYLRLVLLIPMHIHLYMVRNGAMIP